MFWRVEESTELRDGWDDGMMGWWLVLGGKVSASEMRSEVLYMKDFSKGLVQKFFGKCPEVFTCFVELQTFFLLCWTGCIYRITCALLHTWDLEEDEVGSEALGLGIALCSFPPSYPSNNPRTTIQKTLMKYLKFSQQGLSSQKTLNFTHITKIYLK